MTAGESAGVHDSRTCDAQKRQGPGGCRRPAGWGTDHPGTGRCKLHGGASLVRSGRYSTIKRESLRDLIAQHEADPDPLNVLPELGAARALFQDFIERYDQRRDALVSWHQSYRAAGRPLPADQALTFEAVLDEYEVLLNERGESTDKQERDLEEARRFVELLRAPNDGKPVQVLDLSDAVRHLDTITRIVKRIEDIRAQNAISRPDLMRVMQEMGRVVAHHVRDEETREKITHDWLSIHV